MTAYIPVYATVEPYLSQWDEMCQSLSSSWGCVQSVQELLQTAQPHLPQSCIGVPPCDSIRTSEVILYLHPFISKCLHVV